MSRVRWSAALLACAWLTACSTSNLDFVADNRVKFLEPAHEAAVTLPVEISWEAEDFDGMFGVFVDRAPIRPGQDLRSLVPHDDELCRRRPDCPDAAWLATKRVYVTESTSVRIEELADRRAGNRQADRHEVVIVLLDHEGRRVGEAAFVREFTVERED
ncbi:MAG TPA: hypothetical protein VM938_05515 [Acidimicrobiales bacterium]|nr:hypothetical protein [Acidimicrobiales bacterium]